MNRVMKAAALAIAFCLCIGLSACGSSVSETGVPDKEISQSGTSEVQNQAISESEDNDIANSTTESIQYTEETSKTGGQVTDAEPEASGTDVLVVVFSATGTTKGVAEKIVAIESADLYEIIPSNPILMQTWTGMILTAGQRKSRMILKYDRR